MVSNRVIEAMRKVPRDLFVPDEIRSRSYDDTPLPIGHGQTISAPHMVAIMCDLLDLKPGMKVLEVGGGSGYHAAVMARLVEPEGHVYAVEIVPELAKQAMKNLRDAGIRNITVIVGDGSKGLPDHAPYDRISVAAAAPDIPGPLKDQLAKGGRMVIPVGAGFERLVLVTRTDGTTEEELMDVAFVPLVGEYGFKSRLNQD